MNILFLTIAPFNHFSESGIYADLMRKFRDEGHNVTIVSTVERRFKKSTRLIEDNGINILRVKTLNLQKTNVIEKGIGSIIMEYQFCNAIKKRLSRIQFNLVLYSTPPITFTKVIKTIKKRDSAKSYLLLKDIFPQNAVDLGMMKDGGVWHKFFKKKEKDLYMVSDYIGCMSPANVEYVKNHNTDILPEKIEMCPNSISLTNNQITEDTKSAIRERYKIPTENIMVFIYGGNLGKPQGLDFLLQVLKSNNNKTDRFFVIVGSGTEYSKVEQWFRTYRFSNAILIPALPKEEYDQIVRICDVGLIFLDPCFTIPNYPSRLLSYLENKMPVIAATDAVSDIGKIAEENHYGFYSLNGDIIGFNQQIEKFIKNRFLIEEMGENGFRYLKENFTVDQSYNIIMKHFCEC